MKKAFIPAALLAVLAACGNPKPAEPTDGLIVIDVEDALNHLADELKMSDLYDTVRYVPLETNDSCLVGDRPYMVTTDKYLLVSYAQSPAILTFDKETGRFVARIAHQGQGPEEYTSGTICYNEHDGLLYFLREPNQIQRYDPTDGYHGRIVLQGVKRTSSNFLFTDSLIISHNQYMITPNERILDIFNYRGELVDSLIDPMVKAGYEAGRSVQGLYQSNLGRTSFLWADYGNGSIWADMLSNSYVHDGALKYRRAFCDTVYALKDGRLEPSIAFHTGKLHFPLEGRTRRTGVADKVLITGTFETPTQVFFYCARNVYGDEPETYRGVYDRRTGATRLTPDNGELEDDLTHFLPYGGRPLEAYRVVEWLAAHPEAKKNPALAPLLKVQEEDNPVAVITD